MSEADAVGSDISRSSRGIASDPWKTCTITPGVTETTAQKIGALLPNPNHITASSAQMKAGSASPTVTMSVKKACTRHQRPIA